MDADEHVQIENYSNCSLCSPVEWAHPNSIWPLENGDILVSWRHNHLIAVIDRNSKKLKWEWCDPILGHQHDFQALDNGNYMVFANGVHAPAPNNHSRVIEFILRLKKRSGSIHAHQNIHSTALSFQALSASGPVTR